MKLSKIYSNKKSFKTIKFKDWINVIFWDTTWIKKKWKNEHNLGKTALVELIDFLLLKWINKEQILKKNQKKFVGRLFFLEIELNSWKYLTIRRSIDRQSKVSLKMHSNRDEFFVDIDEDDWDQYEWPFKKSKENLNAYLWFDVLQKYDYRKFLSYFLRKQTDYESVFQMSGHKWADSSWKVPLYGFLWLPLTQVDKRYKIQKDVKDIQNTIEVLSKESWSSWYLKIHSLLESLTREKEEKEIEGSWFDFHKFDSSINYTLVNEVENSIEEINNNLYSIEKKITRLENSLKESVLSEFDTEQLFKLFGEIDVNFNKGLQKNYQEIEDFHKTLTIDRVSYLKNELKELNNSKEKMNSDSEKLNKERNNLLISLKENDSFKKYWIIQQDIIQLNKEISDLENQLNNAKVIEKYKKDEEVLKEEMRLLEEETTTQIAEWTATFKKIKQIFEKVFSQTFWGSNKAVMNIDLNEEWNLIFEYSIRDKISHWLTWKSKWYTANKVLCASLVISLLVTYSDQSFIKFWYNDWILEWWGDSLKNNFLKYVRELCKDNDIQYIISVIQSDVPTWVWFRQDEIIRKLNKDDRLYGISF